MRILLLSMLLALLIPVAALAQAGKVDAKAQEVLKQARKAIASEDKLKSLQSLSASGTRRLSMGQMNMEGELEIDLMMPDKIRLSTGMTTPGGDIINIQAINGDKVWTDLIRPIGGGGPGGGGGGGGFRGGGMGGGPDQAKNDILRLSLGLLLTSPGAFPLEYAYAGEAQAPDGKADVIDVKGPGTFAARLFLDQSSHHLLMLQYKGKDFRQMMRGGGRPGGPGAGGAGGQGRPPGSLTREELEKLPPGERAKKEAEMKAARDKRDAEMRETMAKLPDVDYQWNFTDYKSVNGINLPHRISKGIAGETNEEWEISKYKLNQPIKADKFEKKDKEKSPGSN